MIKQLQLYIPALNWLSNYQSKHLFGDITAGIIVTSLLIPQGMAYALLAGLPPQIGLYASILPAIIYPLLGTSQVLSVGPVAVDSLMVAAAIAKLAPQGSSEYLALAIALAFLVGIIEIGMGVLRMGFLVNFLSRSVISGFISGAAIIIGFSQVRHLLGLKIPATESFIELFTLTLGKITEVNWVALSLGLTSIAMLLYFNQPLVKLLKRQGWSEQKILPISKSAPLLVVILGTLLVSIFRWDQVAGLRIVGMVPSGLPPLSMPTFDLQTWRSLLPAATAIALVGYIEGFSGAQALASKRREKIDPNQELIAFGAANLSAAFTGGYPVTGGVSRSVVNFAAGANTGLASIITGILVAIAVMFFTSWFYFLPQTCLAATIITAVYKLIDFSTLKRMWNYDKADAIAWLVTFSAVLVLGVEKGIIFGTIIALSLHLWHTSRPHIAIVGRLGESEHFRNVLRYEVKTSPQVLAIRVDASLYFANAKYMENFLSREISDHPNITSIVLVCSAVNLIDASALEIIESLIADLKFIGINFYFSEVKGPVMDKLLNIGFVDYVGRDRFFLSTDIAMRELAGI
ncbi:sulfate permease [Pseudanabaena sp. FACHB-1277]|uniref:Sulfate permease n=1 Tax=Pseudanabaena cinerea FACHB-1277 TaxID=2949581 RepID=A0A926ZA21_9CYAN|nr:sulfate permease [Pseudanabaena cinerea]MBD2152434.1 sulfate permease [Pseudanabaena cinerea FACHB-1277]